MNELKSTVKFKDIVGIDQYKQEIIKVLDFFKNKEEFEKTGAKLPRGILLHGSPGTGKTMLIKALANETNMKFYYKSGSDFESKYFS